MQKFLIIRFSSIGDIILTTPIVRSLSSAYPDAEIHYLTKAQYAGLLAPNPHIDRLHLLKDDLRPIITQLKQEGFTQIIDLHNNLRTWRVGLALGVPWRRFPKLNFEKFLLTSFKIDRLPNLHIVERYARALPSGVQLDENGLDFFISNAARVEADQLLDARLSSGQPVGVVLGGKFATKRWPNAYFAQLLQQLDAPVILFGGPDERADADAIITESGRDEVLDVVGKVTLQTAGALIQHCQYVLTHDTGLMHMAAALQIPTYVLWGNTVPKFGMYPYRAPHTNLEVAGLSCRPCSKLGSATCPKGHFKCMREQTPEMILSALTSENT